MKIFLDSSRMEEIRKWKPIIEGITTNPSILFKEGGSTEEILTEIVDIPVSVEATGNFESRFDWFTELAGNFGNIVFKIPLLKPDGSNNLAFIRRLSEAGIEVNCTALFSLSQVILATKAGARYVSLFAGRIEDEGGCPNRVISNCMDYLNNDWVELWGCNSESRTELIVGSIRTVGNVLDAVNSGADIVTIPPPVLEKMLQHQYSIKTVQQFEADAKKLGESY